MNNEVAYCHNVIVRQSKEFSTTKPPSELLTAYDMHDDVPDEIQVYVTECIGVRNKQDKMMRA